MSPTRARRPRAPALSRSAGPEGVGKSPLRDYAFIADGERGALIGPSGDIAWMCFPTWSDSALFAGLLGSGGVFRVTPADSFVTGGYYEERSLIWHSRFVTHHGIFESRDALSYPGSADRAILLRRLSAQHGSGDMVVEFAPANDYGRRVFAGWQRENHTFIADDGRMTIRLTVPPAAEWVRHSPRANGLTFGLKVTRGEHLDFVAEFIKGTGIAHNPPDPSQCWQASEGAWRAAVPECTNVIASPDVARSIAVLRSMTDGHGGTIAAATTSLPEREDSDRNFDYRFCWIRDVCYVGQAGATIPGAEILLDDAVRWVGDRLRSDKDHTSPAYLGNGEPIYPPAKLDVPGYPGGTDVVGNRVREQFQLDIFGEALLLFARASCRDRLDAEGWRAASIALEAIENRWDEPEAGIWELEPKRWTHSRLICVAGLRAIADAHAPRKWSTRSLTLADHLLDETARSSLHPSGRWQRAPDDERPDASLLLAEIRGALPASDSRSVATRKAISSELAKDHYLYRYRNPGRELGEDEGVFLICNFWMALAALGAGAPIEAAHWFERGRAAMSTTGLFSEEFDAGEHQLRGNLPQAFVHAMLIEAATALGPC